MAIQKVTDGLTIVQAAGDTYEGNAADQTYTISPTLTSAGDTIVIIDQGGANTIELAGGLTISSSVCVADETQLTLSNGAIVNIRGADTFTFAVGANTAAGQTGQDKTFTEFAADVLGVTLPAAGEAPVSGTGSVSIEVGGNTTTDPGGNVDGDTLTLTTDNDDIANGTDKSDLFDATAQGSLQTGDILLDNSTTDNDVLNATVTGTSAEPRIQNIETVNITGEFVTAGLDLGLSSGINTLTVDTKVAGGTATVTDASSLNAAAIVAGDNIKTLNVTSLSSGTRDSVAVDANEASAVNVTGSGGPDVYAIELAEDATLTLSTLTSAGDQIDVAVAGDATIDAGVAADNGELDLNIEAAQDVVITLSDDTHINAEKMALSGAGNITLKVTDGVALAQSTSGTYDGTAITDNSTGTTTVQATALASGADLRQAVVDVVDVNGVAGASTVLTINQASELLLSGDAKDLTIGIDNADKDTAFTKGTLNVTVADAQTTTGLSTAATVETLVMKAEADKDSDTDLDDNGAHETTLTVADVTLNAATTALVVNGDEALKLTAVTLSANDQVVTASNMTAGLNVTLAGAFDGVVVGGQSSDSITTTLGQVYDIQGGDGNDTISVNAAAAGTEVQGGAGNDTITSSGNEIKIDAGAGDDTVYAAGGTSASAQEKITLGEGADSVKVSANTAHTVVKDFALGTDTIVLNGGTATGNIDLSDVTVTDGAYIIGDAGKTGTLEAGEWGITLENGGSKLTATDLSDSVQLSGVTALDASTIVAGSKNDSVSVAANETATITTGAGSDSVTVNVGSTAKTTATVKDFTVGEDTIRVSGTSEADLSLNLNNVAASSGIYTIGGSTATSGAAFKLENGGSNVNTEDNLTSIVQLSGFTAVGTTKAVSVTGGTFSDSVTLTSNSSAGQVTYNFSNNGGVDTVTLTNADGDERLNFNSLTGIDSAQGVVEKAADAAKTADATDGAVYIFADSANGAGSSKIATFGLDIANGYTQDVVDAEVAAFIDANMGVSAGESYVVIINDTSTSAYNAKGSYANPGATHDAFAYKVTGSADGVQVGDIELIAQIDTTPTSDVVDSKDITGGAASTTFIVSDNGANPAVATSLTGLDSSFTTVDINTTAAVDLSSSTLASSGLTLNLDTVTTATNVTLTAAQLKSLYDTTNTTYGTQLVADSADSITVNTLNGQTGVVGTAADDTFVFASGDTGVAITSFTVGTGNDGLNFDAFVDITAIVDSNGTGNTDAVIGAGAAAVADADIAGNVVVLDTDDFADTAAIDAAIVDATDGTNFLLANGDKAIVLHGDVADGAQTFNVYEVTGVTGGTETITLVGTVAVDDGDALNADQFIFA